MSYVLGVDLGTTFTAAAVCRKAAGEWGKAEVLPLGSRGSATGSVLFLGADGSVLVGEAAERRALTDPQAVAREFKRRIGDRTPLLVGGRPHTAHALAARLARWVVDRATEREGGSPDRLAVTHPAGWGEHKKGLFAEALAGVGLGDAVLVPEPAAAAFEYGAAERVEAGRTVAVYDLGGGTFDAAVLRKVDDSRFELLGEPAGAERLGGVDFDEAVFEHVRAMFADGLGDLAPDDEVAMSAAARLRRECTEAKEALSTDTEVTIPVLLPGVQARARMTRGEFEALVRPALEETVELLRGTVRSAGLAEADLDAVLLVGGSSRIPLVSQLLSDQLGRAVVVDCDPKSTVALGAARSVVPVEEAAVPVTAAAEPPPRPEVADIPLVLTPPERRRKLLRPRVLVGAAVLAAGGIVLAGGLPVAVVPNGLTSPSTAPAAQAPGDQPQTQKQSTPVAQTQQGRPNPVAQPGNRKARGGPNIPDEGLTSNEPAAPGATTTSRTSTTTSQVSARHDTTGTAQDRSEEPAQDPTEDPAQDPTQDPTQEPPMDTPPVQEPPSVTQEPPPVDPATTTQDPVPTTQDPVPTTTQEPPVTSEEPPADPAPTT
ncbi:Hsp70 protein [Lentzea fradiae]|uniref:Hsp70 protein n=1 Tax=Lentzea fradiae TaxID=200378 RepID=A0A1G7KZ05_9PSEU|nr:Hsp70 family protein [Lentzea fradiae]SDF42326.1 Hsp70 protein [Lentzea fradiae]